MPGLFRLFCAAMALALGLSAPAAHAAPVSPDKQARGTVRVVNGIFIRKLRDLNFATLAVSGPVGTAVVNPDTDAMTTTGGVAFLTGLPYAAQFEAVSPVKGVVIIRIPNKPINVTRVGGTETMSVDTWTLSGNSRRTVAAQEPFAFKVGGTLRVNANQAEGTYLGTFDVDIQFP
jgi:hypothetical protein